MSIYSFQGTVFSLRKQYHFLFLNQVGLSGPFPCNRTALREGFLNQVGLSGLEPPTSRLSGVRSNQLSYKPPVPESQGNVNVNVYDGTAIKADENLIDATPLYNATVTAETEKVDSDIKYPSAMDALKTLANSNCTVEEQYGTNVVTAIGTKTNADFDGWQYRVYDASGALVPISAKIGADTYEAKSGETVV